jgi:hypothetical protein
MEELKSQPKLTAGVTNAIGLVINSAHPLSPVNGGTGISNALSSTLTLANALSLSGGVGGTITLPAGPATLVPTTGTGATGLWGISITGNAATVTTNANLTGDVTSIGNATTLATVNGNVGNFGSATQVGTFTVNAKGLITAASNVTISGVSPGGVASGDLSGTYPGPTVAKINGATLGSTTATAGNLLIGSGTQWVSEPVTGNVTISSTGVTTIGPLQVTNSMIANATIDLTTKVTGILPPQNGGTGVANAAGSTLTLANALSLSGGVGGIITIPPGPATLATTASGVAVINVPATGTTMSSNAAINIFMITSTTAISIALPTAATAGQVFKIIGAGISANLPAGGWSITQGTNQFITYQNNTGSPVTTTVSTGGLSSGNPNDSIELVAISATAFTIANSYGNVINAT